ncbi:MAG: tetratricopeptide repeat protein, partial [Acidobacteriota bacterium]
MPSEVPGLDRVRAQMESGAHTESELAARELLYQVESEHGTEALEAALVLDVLVETLRRRGSRELLEEARHLGERALAIWENSLGPDHIHTAKGLNTLGVVAWDQRDFRTARRCFERALTVRENVLGAEHLHTADSLNNIGALARNQQEYGTARRYFERALAVYEKVLGPEHPSTAATLENLGAVARDQADHEGALQYFARTLAIREKVLGAEHPDTAMGLSNLGAISWDQGDHEAGQHYHERALAIRERTLGSEHPDTADSLNSLGAIAWAQAEYESARQYFERALATREKVLGPEHPNTADSLNNIGALAWSQRDYDTAWRYFERALAIREKALGPEHPHTAASLQNLGAIARDKADHEAARQYFARTLTIRQKVLGPEHPKTAMSLNNLGTVSLDQGDHEAAQRYHERALAIQEETLGSEHPDTALSLNNLGVVALEQGNHEAARRYYERALAFYRDNLGPDHPDTASSLNNLGVVALNQGDRDAARHFFEHALEIREKTLGLEHPHTASSFTNLGSVVREQEDYAMAQHYFGRALTIYERLLGPEHPNTAASLANLGHVAWYQGKHESARRYHERALTIREKALGLEHHDTAASHNDLGAVALDQKNITAARRHFEHAVAIYGKALGSKHPKATQSQRNLALTLLQLSNAAIALDISLQAESASHRHTQLMVRTLDERRALGLAAVRVGGLDIASSACLAIGKSDCVQRTWDQVVRSRSLVFDEMVTRHRTALRLNRQSDTPGARQLIERFEEAARTGRILANLVLRGPGDNAVERWQTQIERATSAKEQAERALGEVSASFRMLMERRDIGLEGVQAQLKPTDALVAFLEHDLYAVGMAQRRRSLSAFVLPTGSDSPILVPLGPAEEIETLVREWRRLASRPPLSAKELTSCRQAGKALRRTAWDPIREHLGDARRVFVVADGALQLVSLAALPSDDGRYLVEGELMIHPLSVERDLVPTTAIAPTGHGLLAMGGPDFGIEGNRAANSSTDRLLPDWVYAVPKTTKMLVKIGVFGPRGSCTELSELRFSPLRHAHQESWEITKLWRRHLGAKDGRDAEPAVHHSGPTATEREFKKGAPGRRILHLATHGFFLGGKCGGEPSNSRGVMMADEATNAPAYVTTSPLLLSGLALADANHRGQSTQDGEDGILTAEEVASLDLSGVEWAVLSACETAVGDVRAGEGVLGLQRAFRIAGARTLVMSLWQVDDR